MTPAGAAAMKIYVNRIPAEGCHEETVYDPAALDVARPDLEFTQPIRVAADIIKAEQDVLVRAAVWGTATLSCARCLCPFEAPVEARATLSYQVAPTDVLDITDDIRQELILAYPMIPVCRAECKGLCRICGQNLNLGTCPHQPKARS